MAKEKVKVIKDAEIIEEIKEPGIRTEITLGITEEGSVYYRIAGPDQSLITLEGLLKYAEKQMDQLWVRATEAASQAQ